MNPEGPQNYILDVKSLQIGTQILRLGPTADNLYLEAKQCFSHPKAVERVTCFDPLP